jgi:hypothetical protein
MAVQSPNPPRPQAVAHQYVGQPPKAKPHRGGWSRDGDHGSEQAWPRRGIFDGFLRRGLKIQLPPETEQHRKHQQQTLFKFLR